MHPTYQPTPGTTSGTTSFRQAAAALIATTAAAMLMGAAPAWSQSSTASPGTGSSGPAMGSAGITGAKTANESAMARADSRMLADLAQANMAGIEMGKIALEKSQNEDTKKFAQQMIDDHTAALNDLRTMASTKGVTLPDGPGLMQKTEATALKALSGNTFDNRYRTHAGVGDHERIAKLLQKIQKDAKDPELKAEASKLMPKVEENLKMAQQLQAKKL